MLFKTVNCHRGLLGLIVLLAVFRASAGLADSRLSGVASISGERRIQLESRMLEVRPERMALPSRVANTLYLPAVRNQGGLGTCSAFATFYYAKTYQEAKEHDWQRPDPDVDPEHCASPAFGFKATQKGLSKSGLVAINPYEAADTLARIGCAPWSVDPYSDSMDSGEWPGAGAQKAAMPWRIRGYGLIRDINTGRGLRLLKEHLARGEVAVIVMMLHASFDDYPGGLGDDNGVYHTFAATPEREGHALTVIGYDDDIAYQDQDDGTLRQGALIVVNSWGPGWGVVEPSAGTGGFMLLGYHYVEEGNIDSNSALILFDRVGYEPRLWAGATFSHASSRELSIDLLGNSPGNHAVIPWTARLLENRSHMNPASDATVLTDLTDFIASGCWKVSLYAFDVLDIFSDGPPLAGQITDFYLETAAGATTHAVDLPLDTVKMASVSAAISMFEPDAVAFAGLGLREGAAAWADANGDGRPDLAATGQRFTDGRSTAASVTRLYLQQANGAFIQQGPDLPGSPGGDLVWADMDNDGVLDLVISGASATRLYRNDGNGNLTDMGVVLPPCGNRQLAVADLNADGRLDLILGGTDGTSVHLQGNAQTFTAGIQTLPGLTDGCMSGTDMDGDGLADIVMSGRIDGFAQAHIWRNRGDGTFAQADASGLPATSGCGMAWADWDADGDLDAAIAGVDPATFKGKVWIVRNDGTGRFAVTDSQFTGITSPRLAWGDLDNDGWPDLIGAGRERRNVGGAPEDNWPSKTLFLRNQGNGDFREIGLGLPDVAGGDWLAPLLALGDADGDGSVDIFLSGTAGLPGDTTVGNIKSVLIRNHAAEFPFVARSNTPPLPPAPETGVVAGTWTATFPPLAATDAETPAPGLACILRVGSAPGSHDILSGAVAPQAFEPLRRNSFHLVDLAPGRYYWSARAVDASGALSDWAAERFFDIAGGAFKRYLHIAADPAWGGQTTPAAGRHLYDQGSQAPLVATPNPGWYFVDWTGPVANSGSAATSVTLTQHAIVTARFAKNQESPDLVWLRQTAAAGWSLRGDFGLLSHNGRLWLLGGSEIDFSKESDVWSSADGKTWRRETVAAPWPARAEFMTVSFNGKIWVMGGADGAGSRLNDVWSSSDGKIWTFEGNAPWSARSGARAVVHNSAIWVMGGLDGSYPRDVWRSENGVAWTEVQSWAGWPGRSNFGLLSHDGFLWILGGWIRDYPYHDNDVWRSRDGITWEKMLDDAPWAARDRFGAAVYDGRMWVLGGGTGAAYLNDVWSSVDGVSWVRGTDAGWDTRAGAGCAVHDGKLFVCGGGSIRNDVWSATPKPPPAGTWGLTLNVAPGTESGTTVPPPGRYTGLGTAAISLTAAPSPGWRFRDWQGPVANSAAATTTLVPAGNMNVVANFEIDDSGYANGAIIRVVTEPPAGGITTPRAGSYWLPKGTVQSISAESAFGWRFAQWSGPVADPMAAATTLQFDEAATVTAHFGHEGFAHPRSITGGGAFTVALSADGSVWGWGSNDWWELGFALLDGSAIPYALSPLGGARQLAAGENHVVALLADGGVATWGAAYAWQLGRGLYGSQRLLPERMDTLAKVQQVAAAGDMSLALLVDGTVVGWGTARFGELGSGMTSVQAKMQSRPQAVLGTDGETPLQNIAAIAAGGHHALAITGEGRLLAWGLNSRGQLGDGTGADRYFPVPVGGLEELRLVAAGGSRQSGDYHSLAVLADGTVHAWGANTAGQLGDGTNTDRPQPTPVPGLADIVQIACGARHSVALDRQGRVWTWGSNTFGQLGDGTRDDRNLPYMPAGLPTIREIGAGEQTTFAIAADGSIYAWGQNDTGQTGSGGAGDDASPVPIANLNLDAPAISLSVAMDVQTGAATQPPVGSYTAWDGAILGIAAIPGERYDFVSWEGPAVAPGEAATSATVDGATVLVAHFGLKAGVAPRLHLQVAPADGGSTVPPAGTTAYGIGEIAGLSAKPAPRHDFGQWSGDVPAVATPANVVTMDRDRWATAHFIRRSFATGAKLAAGPAHTLLLKSDSSVTAWGDNNYGQLGRSHLQSPGLPLAVRTPQGDADLADIVAVAAGAAASYALTNDGEILAWGYNRYGACAQPRDINGEPATLMLPAWVPGPDGGGRLGNVVWIGAGEYFALALDADGGLWGWGRNNVGQLGLGDQADRDLPTRVAATAAGRGALPAIRQVGVGSQHCVAVAVDGTAWSWGYNHVGQLGDGTTDFRLAPGQVAGLAGAVQAAAGQLFSMVLLDDGTVWMWGRNYRGVLGTGDEEDHPTPVQVPGLTNIVDISAGVYHAMALGADGTVYAWGYGWHGQLGTGSQSHAFSPVTVSALPGPAADIAAGGYHSLALLADGTLFAWGSNHADQLASGIYPDQWPNPVDTGLAAGDVTVISPRLDIRCNPAAAGTTLPAPGVHWQSPGEVVRLEAVPAAGWRFVRWEGMVAQADSLETTTVMAASHGVVATFEPTPHRLAIGDIALKPGAEGLLPLTLAPGAEPLAGLQFDLFLPEPLTLLSIHPVTAFADPLHTSWRQTAQAGGTRIRIVGFCPSPGIRLPAEPATWLQLRVLAPLDAAAGIRPVTFLAPGRDAHKAIAASPQGEWLVTVPEMADGSVDVQRRQALHLAVRARLAAHAADTMAAADFAGYASVTSMRIDKDYVIELWLSDQGSEPAGVTGGSVDIAFDPAAVEVTALRHGTVFAESASGTIDGGRVTDFGGLTGGEAVGAGQWVRLGWIEAHPLAAATWRLDVWAGSSPFAMPGELGAHPPAAIAITGAPAEMVQDVNQAPAAGTIAVLPLKKDTPAEIVLPGSDPNGCDELIFAIVTPPAHGILTPGNVPGTYTYTPSPGYTGGDEIRFTAGDGDLLSGEGRIGILLCTEASVPLAAGWNFISLPLTPALAGVGEVFAAQTARGAPPTVWQWAGGEAAGGFAAAHELAPFVGYWLHLEAGRSGEESVAFLGVPKACRIEIRRGWQALGTAAPTAVPAGGAVKRCLRWDGTQWVEAADMLPGAAYWIWADGAATIEGGIYGE